VLQLAHAGSHSLHLGDGRALRVLRDPHNR
jgi:hypothetical protein